MQIVVDLQSLLLAVDAGQMVEVVQSVTVCVLQLCEHVSFV